MKHENYRHYIQSEFENRRIRNPSYSLRAFARDLKTSPSRLSESINGKRGISMQLAQNIARALELDGIDAEVFLLSVEAEHSRSQRQKKVAQEKLKQALASKEISPKTFTIVNWVADALLKMNEREAVADSIERAAERLSVPKFMAIESLRFLTRLGFIADAKNFKTYLQGRGKGRKLNVDYIQVLEQAHKAYVVSGAGDQFVHQAFLLEKKDMERAHRIMLRAMDEIRKLELRTKNSKVVFVANQIFPSKGKESKMIKRISHVMMWGQNLENIGKWYKEKLGFSIGYHAPGEFLSMNHAEMGRLDFHATDDGDKSNIGKGPIPYFIVENLDEAKAWLESKGVQVDEIQQVGDSPKHTWFWDCEGNVIGLEEF